MKVYVVIQGYPDQVYVEGVYMTRSDAEAAEAETREEGLGRGGAVEEFEVTDQSGEAEEKKR